LRARFLARHRGGARVARAMRRSIVPDRPVSLLRAPSIAVGLGEKAMALPPLRLASLTMPDPLPRLAPAAPAQSCASETLRLRNYAAKVIDGVTASPDEDLKLFEPDGTPSERLFRVMANMAAVEIGPMKADEATIRAGIADALAALRAAGAGTPATPTP
jgi:hypothetical protein